MTRIGNEIPIARCPYCKALMLVQDGAIIEHLLESRTVVMPDPDPQPPEPVMAPKGRTPKEPAVRR